MMMHWQPQHPESCQSGALGKEALYSCEAKLRGRSARKSSQDTRREDTGRIKNRPGQQTCSHRQQRTTGHCTCFCDRHGTTGVQRAAARHSLHRHSPGWGRRQERKHLLGRELSRGDGGGRRVVHLPPRHQRKGGGANGRGLPPAAAKGMLSVEGLGGVHHVTMQAWLERALQ